MKAKLLVASLLVGMLFQFLNISAYTQMPPNAFQEFNSSATISPLWANVNDISLDLYFENGEACCAGMIRALSGTTRISATFKLERKTTSGWVLERSWSKTTSTNTLSFFKTDSVSSGYKYRLSVIANVTRNGVTEKVSASVESKY